MEQFIEGESTREEIKNKLRQNFDGKKISRIYFSKDLS